MDGFKWFMNWTFTRHYLIRSAFMGLAFVGVSDPVFSQANEVVIWEENWEENAFNRWFTDFGTWEMGVPESGPGEAFEGENLAGTILAGNYSEWQDTRLIQIQHVLVPPASENPRLRLWHWYSLAAGEEGILEIRVEDGDWERLDTITSTSHGWVRPLYDLSAYADLEVQFSLHFISRGTGFRSGDVRVSSGWYVDTIELVTGRRVFENPEGWEDGIGDWYTDRGTWDVGPITSGPNEAHGGSYAAATVIDGNYQEWVTTRLISPFFRVPSTNPRLRFWHWFSFNAGDQGTLQIRTEEGAWETIETYGGNSGGIWTFPFLSISNYADSIVQLSFLFTSTGTGFRSGDVRVSSGWYIDNLEIQSDDDVVGPKIEINHSALDFGKVADGDINTQALEISNFGNEDLVIEDIRINSNEFSVDITSTTVAPDDKISIDVHFRPESLGNKTGRLTIVSNAIGKPTETINLSGQTEFTIKHIPTAQLPEIDGDISDWQTLFPIPHLTPAVFTSTTGEIIGQVPIDDQTFDVWLGWNEETNLIYVAAIIEDDAFGTTSSTDPSLVWRSDGMELYIDADNSGGPYDKDNMHAQQYVINPAGIIGAVLLQLNIENPPEVQSVAKREGSTYIYEWAIPGWDNIEANRTGRRHEFKGNEVVGLLMTFPDFESDSQADAAEYHAFNGLNGPVDAWRDADQFTDFRLEESTDELIDPDQPTDGPQPIAGSGQLQVNPTNPTNITPITLTISGDLPIGNASVVSDGSAVDGQQITITAHTESQGDVGPTVVTPWEFTESLGMINAGEYHITVEINGETFLTSTLSVLTEEDRPEGSISMDLDLATGDQEQRVAQGLVPGDIIQVQLNVKEADQIEGWNAVIVYNPVHVLYQDRSFEASDFIPGLLQLVGDNQGEVSVGGATPSASQAASGDATLGTLSFVVLEGFAESDGTELVINQISFFRQDTGEEIQTVRSVVTLERCGPPGDFNCDGIVNFSDFFVFVGHFNRTSADEDWKPVCDLNDDDIVDFRDFFIFIGLFEGEEAAKLMVAAEELLGLPAESELEANYPNPFNPSTAIPYQVGTAGDVELAVYDLLGQQVRMLVQGDASAGRYVVEWDGMDERGLRVASGVYIYRLRVGEYVQARRLTLIK